MRARLPSAGAAIAPGVVISNLHTATNSVDDYDAFLERSKQTHPLGFVGEGRDVAALADAEGVPRADLDDSTGVIGDLATVTAGFRQHFYAIAAAVPVRCTPWEQ